MEALQGNGNGNPIDEEEIAIQTSRQKDQPVQRPCVGKESPCAWSTVRKENGSWVLMSGLMFPPYLEGITFSPSKPTQPLVCPLYNADCN